MKVNYYKILEDCVIAGINKGYERSVNFGDTYSSERVKENILWCIMEEMEDVFIFERDEKQN